MRLTKTPAQAHSYNLKLTKSELLSITRTANIQFDFTNEDWDLWCKMIDMITKEGKRLGNTSSE